MMRRILLLLFVALLGIACNRPDAPGPLGPTANLSADQIFSNSVLLRIDIEIPRQGMRALRQTQWGGGGDAERPKARATVKEGGTVYKDVAVHLKGAAGSFRPVDGRPCLTLNFDKFAEGQSFHGLHKISLNNSVQDSTYLSEKICREWFEAAGVPVPRAGHALVRLNGRDLGLYVLLEGANKQFLKRHFKNAKGNLYDGGFVRDINENLSLNCGSDPNNDSGLKALITAVNSSRTSNRFERLEQALDVDRFVSMAAMEIIVGHWDGYCLNKNNWRVFHDLDAQKMVFIPHGVDQTFGQGGRVLNRDFQRVHWQGRVAAALMSTSEGRRRFMQRFGEICTNVLDPSQVAARIDAIEAQLVPAIAEWNPSVARDQERQAARFKQRALTRFEALRSQPLQPVRPVRVGSDGTIRLSRWEPAGFRSGGAVLRRATDEAGTPVLSIKARGASSSSWRSRVLLPEGRYRFEGRVCAREVVVQEGDNRSGAGLRISRGAPVSKLSGTTGWETLTYDFDLGDETEVELVCEMKAESGEALFDSTSLRLRVLP